MASEFIGYTILVTLKSPPPAQQVQGIVADVVGQQLVLKDGMKQRSCTFKGTKTTDISQSLFSGLANTFHYTKSILLPLPTWRSYHNNKVCPIQESTMSNGVRTTWALSLSKSTTS